MYTFSPLFQITILLSLKQPKVPPKEIISVCNLINTGFLGFQVSNLSRCETVPSGCFNSPNV